MLELDPFKELPNPGETALIEVRPTVAIIGSGLAGMVAARLLAERGYPVTVFDKGHQSGGRASTRHEGPYTFDHGCQYFTARDRRFQRYVEAWVEQGIISVWNAHRASCLHGTVHLVEDDVDRYVGVPGMDAISQRLAMGIDVRQDTEITAIQQSGYHWNLSAHEQPCGEYEIVIVSAPANQTSQLLQPASPHVAEEAARVQMLPCWSVMVAFDYDLDVPFDAAHFSSCPIVWAANNGTKPGRSRHECWVIQASPSWTLENTDSPADNVAATLLAAFFEASGITPVKPSFIKAHRWLYASPAEPLHRECLWDSAAWIGACGDWCHSARMEGAFISGLAIAERIINDCPRARQFADD